MRRTLGALVPSLALVVMGCTGMRAPTATPQPTATPTLSATSTPTQAVTSPIQSPTQPTTTARTITPTATPTAAPITTETLTSVEYPYSLMWPVDEQTSAWRPASDPWDGVSRIDNQNRFTDSIGTTDGILFAFGVSTDESVDEFERRVAQGATQWHGCHSAPASTEPLDADGAAGLLVRYQCGPTHVLRWIGVKDEFGLAVLLLLTSGADPEEASGRFAERVGLLDWRD